MAYGRTWLKLCLAAFFATTTAHAASTGIALVVGNSAYTSLPPLPGCAKGPLILSSALQNLGFEVIERSNASIGQLDGAIGILTDTLRANPGKPLLIYFCGYFAGLNNRPFLIPSTASPQSTADILTQGMLAKAFVDVTGRSGTRSALLVMDAVPTPGLGAPINLETLNQPDIPVGLNLLGATVGPAEASGDAPTALTAALAQNLKSKQIQIADLIDNVSDELVAKGKEKVTLRRNATEPGYLVGAPPPPPVVTAAPVVPAAAPSPPPPPPPPAAAPAPVAAAAPPVADLLEAARMTDADRRVAQTALARLGYYAGPIDGVFGVETLAAIRRLQHELKAPMTGQLTAAQAHWLAVHQ